MKVLQFAQRNGNVCKIKEKETSLTFATKAEIALQTAVVLFWNRNYKQALKAIRPILNAGKPFSQLPQTKPIRFLNILIHCELNDHDYLASEIRSFERDLKKRGKPLKSEEIILKSVSFILKETDTKKFSNKLQQQKETLQELRDNPFERQLLNSFDFIGWLEGKLNYTD
jgi:dienelactone hydrolase